MSFCEEFLLAALALAGAWWVAAWLGLGDLGAIVMIAVAGLALFSEIPASHDAGERAAKEKVERLVRWVNSTTCA
jgi:hypothetical protein